MCDKNINEILDLNFDSVNDEFNWLNNTNNAIQTESGRLKLDPDSNTSRFTRSLGDLDASNNRIQLQCNLSIFRPQSSTQSNFCATFEIFNGSNLVGVYTLFIDNIEPGQSLEYNFDRVYKYENLSGAISLKITTTDGWENQMFLDYIKCNDFNFCPDDVRNYFVLESFLLDSIESTSSAIQLLEYKIDGVETLTTEFFSENNSPGGNPINDWFFAKANIDGSNRNSENTDPNTFNPFISEFGLTYDDANYYDGKPTGVTSGSDYGSGILNFGFKKPSVLNGDLEVKSGAFFVDIDFTKDLKIVFNVLVNNDDANVFNSPDIFRRYTISWSVEKCSASFYYNDVLKSDVLIDQKVNGFLSGLTGTESSIETIFCDEDFQYSGNEGDFSFVVDFGNDIGQAGINYNAFNQPDKFEIEWNGQIFSSGYVGLNTWDQQLINLGINPSEINTGSPGTGIGSLLFNKDQATPNTAIVRVHAPISGTAWNVDGVCPSAVQGNVPPIVDITSQTNVFGQGDEQTFSITASDADGTIESWSIQWGNEGSTSGQGAPPSTINKTFNTLGLKTVVINVIDNDGLVGSDSYQVRVTGSNSYQVTGATFLECNTAFLGIVLTVSSGQVTIKNEFIVLQGNPVSSVFTVVDEGVLNANESMVLGVGVYTIEQTDIDCTNGSGTNELIITT